MKVETAFWVLAPTNDDRKMAVRDESVHCAPPVICPVEGGHRRFGRRLGDLIVSLPAGPHGDFIWTWGDRDCLMQDNVCELLANEHVTGFSTRPVTVVSDNSEDWSQSDPLRLTELVVTGWGGIAPEESGIKFDVQASCTVCGYLRYSTFTKPSLIVDAQQWDGSDIFMVWPLPKFIFVTGRVATLIRSNELTGLVLKAPEELVAHSNVLAPGRLSYLMPEERAQRLGGKLGIV